MISVYDIGNTAYTANGNAVLHPTRCVMTEDAGGSYEVSMDHPLTDGWEHLTNGAIIKVPVPVPVIQSAYVGQDVDVYTVNSNGTELHEAASEATRIYYPAWVPGASYVVGNKVTSFNQNYECNTDLSGGEVYTNPGANGHWTPIANFTPGSPVLSTLSAGTELYYIEASSTTGWSKVSTKLGIEGFVKDSQITFARHETVQPVPERVVEDQLFRIYNVLINTDAQSVSVNARHVSYDLSGILLSECELNLQEPAWAIMRIINAMLIEYQGQIATNLTAEENGTYTGSLSNKNASQAFLDPDKGIIPYFRAKLIRDNWDLFLMKNDLVDRGIKLTYGTNLKGVSWTRKSDGIINRVMPVAKAEDGADLFLPDKWVDSENSWPVIIMERLNVKGQVGKDDGTGTDTVWTEEALLQEMQTKAEERFSVDHVDAVQVELTVNFTLLGTTEEYKAYRELEKLYMYDLVRVQDPRVGLDLQLQVSRIEWDGILERYNSIKVGNVFDYGGRTVYGYHIGDGAIEYEKISTETVRRIIGEVE